MNLVFINFYFQLPVGLIDLEKGTNKSLSDINAIDISRAIASRTSGLTMSKNQMDLKALALTQHLPRDPWLAAMKRSNFVNSRARKALIKRLDEGTPGIRLRPRSTRRGAQPLPWHQI